MLDLEMERKALNETVLCLKHQRLVTSKQVKALAILVTKGLQKKNKPTRIAVLRYLIGDAIRESLGVEFKSYKNMSGETASLLIDLLLEPNDPDWRLSDYGDWLISTTENTLETQAFYRAQEAI